MRSVFITAAATYAVLLTIFFVAFFAVTANAQPSPTCAPSIKVLKYLHSLGESVHETMTVAAADGSGNIMWVIWVNHETGSWTLTGTRGSITCVAAGAHHGYDGRTIADFVKIPEA